MPPAMRKATDVLAAVGLTAAVFFVIVVVNAFLMSRGNYSHGFNLWYSFILRPDILGTIVLTAVVSNAYVFWKGSGRGPRL
jgi:ABC-type sulfate transport system permease subunit